MEIIRERAFARAGLIGNPSDGYHGRTIALTIPDFQAEVTLYDWPELEIVWSRHEQNLFGSVYELADDVRLHGYYGGLRLIKATIKRFVDYCNRHGIRLHERNFSVRYESTIPRQVGMAGSSGIVTATLRALMRFYHVVMPKHIQPSLILSVETKELGIPAGLQDRVAQVYEGLVFMDFSKSAMREEEGLEYGRYEPLDSALLPPLYLAYDDGTSEPTEIVHNTLRARYEMGDSAVHDAMRRLADLTLRARQALDDQDANLFGRLIDENFDIRRSICTIAPRQLQMVETARGAGASAKFAGSGGAVIGTYRSDAMYSRLVEVMRRIHCRVLKAKPATDKPS